MIHDEPIDKLTNTFNQFFGSDGFIGPRNRYQVKITTHTAVESKRVAILHRHAPRHDVHRRVQRWEGWIAVLAGVRLCHAISLSNYVAVFRLYDVNVCTPRGDFHEVAHSVVSTAPDPNLEGRVLWWNYDLQLPLCVRRSIVLPIHVFTDQCIRRHVRPRDHSPQTNSAGLFNTNNDGSAWKLNQWLFLINSPPVL